MRKIIIYIFLVLGCGQIHPQPPVYQVVVLWWQSNSVVRAKGTPQQASPNIHVFSRGANNGPNFPYYPIGQEGDLIPAREPLPNWDSAIQPNNISWIIEFVEGLSAGNNLHYIIVPIATGNTGFGPKNYPASWKIGMGLHIRIIDQTEKAMQKPGVTNDPIFVGIGGENDSEGRYYNPNFQQDLDGFIYSLKERWPASKFVLGTMADKFIQTRGETAQEVNDIIKDTPARIKGVAVADLSGLGTYDNVHFNEAANRDGIAERFLQAYKNL